MKKIIKELLFMILIIYSMNLLGQKSYDNYKLIIYQADNNESVIGEPCQFDDYFIRINYNTKVESIDVYYIQLFDKIIREEKTELKSSIYNIRYFQPKIIIDIIKNNKIKESVSIDYNGFMKINDTIYLPNKNLIFNLEHMLGFINFNNSIDYDKDPILKK